MNITIIGIDLAKSVLQLHDIDADGEIVFRKKLRRSAVMDFRRAGSRRTADSACLCEAHMRRQKNDAANAEAICEV